MQGPWSGLPVSPAGAGWLLACFGIALGGAFAARRYALRRDLVDHPGERRSHAVATPRGGGIGIVLALFVAIAVAANRFPGQAVALAVAGIGLLLVAGIGWLDDHRPLSPWPRLAVHAFAAGLLAAATWLAGGPPAVPVAAFALAMVLVNIWNFMDGIDGIAVTQALVVACAFALPGIDPVARWMALALAAACLGFLPLNLVNARIFLGDVGSGTLGYALALVMALTTAAAPQDGSATRIWAWMLVLLPPSAFLVDASLTLLARIVRGERWWTAHVGHAYQRWSRTTGRHWPVMLAYAAWAVAGTALAFSARDRSVAVMMSAGTAWYLGGGTLWLWLQSRCSKGLPGNKNE